MTTRFREQGKYRITLCNYKGVELSHSFFMIHCCMHIQFPPSYYGAEGGSYYRVVTPSGKNIILSNGL